MRYCLFIILTITTHNLESQNINFSDSRNDSLYSLVEKAKGIERVPLYTRLAQRHSDSLSLSVSYLEKGLKVALQLNNYDSASVMLERIATLLQTNGKYEKAIDYYTKGLALSKSKRNPLGVSKFYRLIGIAHYYSGAYDKSLENHFESLKFAQMVKSDQSKAGAYNNIGIVYERTKKYDLALDYFKKAESIFSEKGMQENLALCQINIGNIYFHNGDNQKALEYYSSSYHTFTKLADIENIALAAQNKAIIYEILEDYDKSNEFNTIALDLYTKVGNKRGIATISYNLGLYHLNKKDYRKAEEYLNLSLKNARETESINTLLNTVHSLYLLNKEKGKYRDAMEFLEESNSLVDSIYAQEIEKKIASVESKIQLEQKEKEYGLLVRYVIIVSILSVLVFIVLFFYLSLKVRSNRRLLEQNAKIESQKQKLEEVITNRNRFFSIIAHDLKNPLAAFIGITELLLSSSIDADGKTQLTRELNNLSLNLHNLLDNLLLWGKSQSGDIDYAPTHFNLTDLVKDAVEMLKVNANLKNIEITNRLNGEITVYADLNMVSTVIQNLLTNAIKFTCPSGSILIQAEVENKNIKLTISDNGIGISPGNLNKLFVVGQIDKRLGTNNEPGTGLGLVLCKEFIERNNGAMIVESEPGKGSTFGFLIPVVGG